jgi:formate hydrogenlyase subunit 4
VIVSSPPAERKGPDSWWSHLLETFKHVTDEETRTQNALKLMPWVFVFVVLLLTAACVIAALITGHVHMAVIARSAVFKWTLGLSAGSTATVGAVVRIRKAIAKSSTRAADEDQDP